MDEQIFRKKSLDRISSPEQLDDYLKVSTPNLWLVLCAVIVLLFGILTWASVDYLETSISAVGTIENKEAEIVLTGNDAERIQSGMQVRVGTYDTVIDFIQYDELGRAIAICAADVPNGSYKVDIILERIHPISFLFK